MADEAPPTEICYSPTRPFTIVKIRKKKMADLDEDSVVNLSPPYLFVFFAVGAFLKITDLKIPHQPLFKGIQYNKLKT